MPLAVLIVNDDDVEVRYPGAVSGFLSDIAGLCLAPTAVIDRIERHRRRPVGPPRTGGARDPRPCWTTVATRALTTLTLKSALQK